MAQINLTIPDAHINRVTDALCASGGYQAQIPDPANPGQTIPNPVGKPAFAKSVVSNWIRNVVSQVENQTAISAAAAGVAAPPPIT